MLACKKKESALSGKLREQGQMESDYKYLKGVVENRSKELDEVKSKLSAY
jgi:hypothetical protein